MLKKIQFNKIILVIFVINILIISGLGIFFLNSLNILTENIQNDQIQELQRKTTYLVGMCDILLAIFGIVIASVLSKYVIYPINKLIKVAAGPPTAANASFPTNFPTITASVVL